MPRLSPEKRAELEAFWWAPHEAWKRSDLNQREYFEVNDLQLKRLANWRPISDASRSGNCSKLLPTGQMVELWFVTPEWSYTTACLYRPNLRRLHRRTEDV